MAGRSGGTDDGLWKDVVGGVGGLVLDIALAEDVDEVLALRLVVRISAVFGLLYFRFCLLDPIREAVSAPHLVLDVAQLLVRRIHPIIMIIYYSPPFRYLGKNINSR